MLKLSIRQHRATLSILTLLFCITPAIATENDNQHEIHTPTRALKKTFSEQQLPITIFIYAKNAAQTVKANLDSIFMQQYQQYRIIYFDDASTDETKQEVKNYIATNPLATTIELITSQEPLGELKAMYITLNTCQDNEIIVLLNAHDKLANEWIFEHLNNEYTNNDTWLTFGAATSEPKGCNIGLRNGPIPEEIIKNKHFRKIFPYMPTRTFYAWLFKHIKKQDLVNPATGDFYEHAAECYIMWPLMEMADTHFKALTEVTYIVNCSDPIAKLTEDYYVRMACNSQMSKDMPIYPAINKDTSIFTN